MVGVMLVGIAIAAFACVGNVSAAESLFLGLGGATLAGLSAVTLLMYKRWRG